MRDTVEEFQERRAEAFGRAKFWLVPVLAGFAGALVCVLRHSDEFILGIWIMLAIVGIFGVILIMRGSYRCPVCEEEVTESDGSWPLFPRQCRHCGAKLG